MRTVREPQDVHGDGDSGGGPVLLLAGLADLALSTCGSALKATYGLLGRSDIGSLAAQSRQDLRARGRLAVDRLGTDRTGTGTGGIGGGEAHMEVLARHALRRNADETGATGGSGGPGV